MKQTNKDLINPSANFISTDQLSTNSALLWSLGLIRIVGYALLVFFVIDIIDIIIPPRLMNPDWEFQAFGALIERVPLPLIGFAMILAGKDIRRNRLEGIVFRVLPWLALLFSLMYFLLIPLGIFNTTRLLQQNDQQLIQVEEQIARVSELQTTLKQAQTTTAIEGILKELGNENPLPKLENNQQFEELKKQIAVLIDNGANNLKSQSDSIKATQLNLLKKSVKWNLSSIISGVLFAIFGRFMRRF